MLIVDRKEKRGFDMPGRIIDLIRHHFTVLYLLYHSPHRIFRITISI